MSRNIISSRCSRCVLLVATVWLFGIGWAGLAAAQPSSQPSGAFDISDYTEPPANGGRSGAVGGISRSNTKLPSPLVYAPLQHLPLTSKAQPILYYYIPTATTAKIDITFVDPKSFETISAPGIDGVSTPGMQRFDFASTGKSLKPNVIYHWTVAVRSDSKEPANDNDYHQNIRFVEPSAELKAQLDGKSVAEQASIYAKNHYWFETVAAVVDIIHAHPNDAAAKDQFKKLLKAGNCPVNAADVDANP